MEGKFYIVPLKARERFRTLYFIHLKLCACKAAVCYIQLDQEVQEGLPFLDAPELPLHHPKQETPSDPERKTDKAAVVLNANH